MVLVTAELAGWLTQLWDEQEALAREAHYEGQEWLPEEESVIDAPSFDVVYTADRKVDARHIAEWSPAAVLARIAADRQILALHTPHRVDFDQITGCSTCSYRDSWEQLLIPFPCATVRLLAQPYADRPGFEEAWRVTA